jgi:hypothetical protein
MKPVFLVILFLLVFPQLMGKSFLHEANNLFAVECQDEKQGADEISFSDTTDEADGFMTIDKNVLFGLEKTGCVYIKASCFDNIFNTSFWRPPQKNLFF